MKGGAERERETGKVAGFVLKPRLRHAHERQQQQQEQCAAFPPWLSGTHISQERGGEGRRAKPPKDNTDSEQIKPTH